MFSYCYSRKSLVASLIYIEPSKPSDSILLAITTSYPYMSYLTMSVPMIPPIMSPYMYEMHHIKIVNKFIYTECIPILISSPS